MPNIERGRAGAKTPALGLVAVLGQVLEEVTFRLDARRDPDAAVVAVVGPFNRWNTAVHRLVRDASGWGTITLLVPPGEYPYLFVIDGVVWNDPEDDRRVPREGGGFHSVRVVRSRAHTRIIRGCEQMEGSTWWHMRRGDDEHCALGSV